MRQYKLQETLSISGYLHLMKYAKLAAVWEIA